jgi:hypothetical protein
VSRLREIGTPMASNRSRAATLIGLGAAAGAFGVAAMMSAATAPTARADAYSDIISAVDGDFAAGQAEFASASADFGSSDPSDGLAAFFSGLDDDLFGPGDSVYIGTVEALTNESTSGDPFTFEIGSEPDFTSGLADAQASFTLGEGFFAQAATDLSSGDYGDAANFEAVGTAFSLVFAPEDLLEGVAASF